MKICSALTVHVEQSEVSFLENGSYELTERCAVRALAEIGTSIHGTACELRFEDGRTRDGVLLYDREVDAERVTLLLKPEALSTPVAA
jgi:hypothetical protein